MQKRNTELDSKPDSKTALISGASGGIGQALARRLSTNGYRLFLLGRDSTALSSVAGQCKQVDSSIGILAGDLRDESYMTEALRQAMGFLKHIDVLVNNAGAAAYGAVQTADINAWRSVLDINFSAAVYLSRFVLPDMIANKRGTVINISSLSGRNTSAGDAIYAATKHAMIGFAECLYEDVRDFGIKVSTIMPGFVDTPFTASLGKRAENMFQADDIADAVDYILRASPSCCPTEVVIRPQLRP
jgi:NADP-dependent 3-hydroxy acid dehydrogenase YdfG